MKVLKNSKSEQITLDRKLVFKHDIRLTRTETKNIYQEIFGDEYQEIILLDRKIHSVKDGEKQYILLTSQISYLGNPHPTYKKRVQLKSWFKDVYDFCKKDPKYDIRLIGIYRFGKQIIFADFNKEPYFRRKMHNSSAHLYTNDLYQSLVHDIFTKRDEMNNLITTIRKDKFKDYILNKASLLNDPEQEILKSIDTFNKLEHFFGEWIYSDSAIRKMRDASFSKWKETEWAGFYVEYLYDEFIKQKHLTHVLEYINNKKSDKRKLDFDLVFSEANFYGDLKSSSINQKDTILNDKGNITFELANYFKLWYIIYEHETVKDIDLKGHPYTTKRLEIIREVEPNYKIGNDDSYLKRMKAKVKYTKMFIVEVNQINYKSLLEETSSKFHNSDGNLREPKLKLTKQNIKNSIIYSYSIE